MRPWKHFAFITQDLLIKQECTALNPDFVHLEHSLQEKYFLLIITCPMGISGAIKVLHSSTEQVSRPLSSTTDATAPTLFT
jgi:hypothetical protein